MQLNVDSEQDTGNSEQIMKPLDNNLQPFTGKEYVNFYEAKFFIYSLYY